MQGIDSDEGTNFIGGDAELRKLLQERSKSSSDVYYLVINEGTEWLFNPPGAPHFVGLWEAAMHSMKKHLKRRIGERKLTFTQFYTLLCRIEAVLNSRP